MVLPENCLVSSYKSAMCAAWKCYLRVYGLFLLFPLLSDKPLLTSHLLRSTAHRLCSTLPACLLPAHSLRCLVFRPQRSYLAPLGYGPWP